MTTPTQSAVFTPVPGSVSGIDYTPTPTSTKPPRPDGMQNYITGGAAAADYNNDGWVDLYITRMDAPDLLYQNNGDGTFTDVASLVGINRVEGSNGVAFADINNDGYQDIYVTTVDHDRHYLYLSDGQGQFTEEGISRNAALDTGIEHFGMGVSFGDYDGDGYLDIHTTEWRSPEDWNNGQLQNHTRLLHNNGAAEPGYFTDVTKEAGVDIPSTYAFNSHFTDLDRDGHQDLIVTGDLSTSKLFWNNGDGTFTDGTVEAGVGTDKTGMGLAVGDYDGDGLLDYFVTAVLNPGGNLDGNRLYHNEGNRVFSDQTDAAGVREGGWGWGTSFLDYDNDGDLDIAMTNGINTAGANPIFQNDPTILWRNNGDGTFTDVTSEVGITDTASGRGLLSFDYDKDGDLDLFVVNNGSDPIFYRNDGGNANDWLKVDTVGTISNADGVGAFITVIAEEGGPKQIREVSASSDFLGQSEITAHFGLGDLTSDSVHLVRIEWLSGIVQEFHDVPKNTVLVAEEEIKSLVSLDGSGNLTVTDLSNNIDNNLTITASVTDFTISDPSNILTTSITGTTGSGTNTITVPAIAVTGSQIIVNGGGGNDIIKAFSLPLANAVTFNGGDDNDQLKGSRSDDILSGGSGNDLLQGGAGADELDGGEGSDTAYYLTSASGVTVDLSTGMGTGGDAEGDTLTNVERVRGSEFDDSLIGDAGNNILRGGAGGDNLTGGTGFNTFFYNALTDSLFPNFDVITDLKIGVDRINGPTAVAAAQVNQLGNVVSPNEAGIQAVLTAADFEANQAATFTFGMRTFLALNDGVAGYLAADDAVIEITGFTGSLGDLAIS